MLNLSPLFFSSNSEDATLLGNITLTPEQRVAISNSKTAIRQCLRLRVPQVIREQDPSAQAPEPRFFTQGSWVYKTLNAPAHPTQQADIDDGAYLPLSFVRGTGRPSIASAAFFSATEQALQPLVAERGWTLRTDKPTCVRVEIDGNAHIDVPLYAIPDGEFQTLVKAALEAYGIALDAAVRRAEADVWTKLPHGSVLLAHREEDWIASDPRPVRDWFLDEVQAKGEQLRRVVRYLKAFRDWQWPRQGPASILLMAAAVPVFEARSQRDDLALLDVVAKLPTKLRQGVSNPTDDAESLTQRLGAAATHEMANAFQTLEQCLRGAVHASDASQACSWMVEMFGPRFPREPARIKPVTIAATVAAAPAVPGPSELVGRTKAG